MKNFTFSALTQTWETVAIATTRKWLMCLMTAMLGLGALMGQHLEVEQTDPPDSVRFNITELPWELTPYNPVPPGIQPFYWVFTIYGNGEYSPRMERTKPNPSGPGTVEKFCWENYPYMEDPSHPGFLIPTGFRDSKISFSYAYPKINYSSDHITYSPVSLVFERKGGPSNPGKSVLNDDISFNSDDLSSGEVMEPTIPTGRFISLSHSHGYLESVKGHNQSVFIVSYKPCNSSGGRVHLFYGRKRLGYPLNNDFIRSDHLYFDITPDFQNYRLPNYYGGHEDDVSFNSFASVPPSFSHRDFIEFNNDYVSKVRMAFQNDDCEFRFFDIVGYKHNIDDTISTDELGSEEWSYALAVLTTEATTTCNQISLGVLNRLFSDLNPSDYNSTEHTLYGQQIVDYDDILLKSGEPTDPNGISITKICESYVLLKLQFSNYPFATANAESSQVVFKVINDNFEWCGLDGKILEYPLGKEVNIASRSHYIFHNPIPGYARYFCNNDSISINKQLAPGEGASINVILKPIPGAFSGSLNILQYLHENQVLEASIRFNNNNPLIVRNELAPKDSLLLSTDCPVPVCESCSSIFSPGVYLAGVFLLAIIIWGVHILIRRIKK